jgi:hypothetical protein
MAIVIPFVPRGASVQASGAKCNRAREARKNESRGPNEGRSRDRGTPQTAGEGLERMLVETLLLERVVLEKLRIERTMIERLLLERLLVERVLSERALVQQVLSEKLRNADTTGRR